jgi:hypothetical protein
MAGRGLDGSINTLSSTKCREARPSSGMTWIGMTRHLQFVRVFRWSFLFSWDPAWTELRLRDVVF